MKSPIVRKSDFSNTYAYCIICRSGFCIGHGWIGDIAKHVTMSKHTAKAAESGPFTRKIEQFFVDSTGKDLNVIGAEALFTKFIVERNLLLACTDHVGPLFRKIFPNSATATK